MPGKTRYQVFALFLFVLILLDVKYSIAQQNPVLDRKVSFTFTDMPLANVLRTIGNKTNLKFSYNPEFIQSNRRVTKSFKNIPLRDVIKQLLNDPSISIREIGNQIVLYRGDPSQIPLEPNQQLIQGKPQIILPTKKTPDTVFVYQLDTLIINHTDTLFRTIKTITYDTIRITDTVFIEKSKPPQKSGKNLKDNFSKNSYKHKKFLEDNGFYSGLYFEMLPGASTFKNTSTSKADYLEMTKQANSGKLSKFSTGIVAGYDYHKVGIRTGLGFTRLGEKFGYSYNLETGGFYKKDSNEFYYTIVGIDTTIIYLYDSTWIPKDLKLYSHKNPNTYRYIDVPVSVKYRFWQNETAEIYALGGIKASILVSVDAMHIDPADKNAVLITPKSDLNPLLLSWQLGIGTAIKFTTRTGILAEASYVSLLNNQFKNIPVEKRYNLIGLKVAAYVKF